MRYPARSLQSAVALIRIFPANALSDDIKIATYSNVLLFRSSIMIFWRDWVYTVRWKPWADTTEIGPIDTESLRRHGFSFSVGNKHEGGCRAGHTSGTQDAGKVRKTPRCGGLPQVDVFSSGSGLALPTFRIVLDSTPHTPLHRRPSGGRHYSDLLSV